MLFYFDEVAGSVQCCGKGLACFKPVLTFVKPADGVDGAVGVEHVDDLEVVLLPQIMVVGVVSGGHLEATCTKLSVHVVVLDDGDAAPGEGDNGPFSMQVRVTFVFGMNANGGVGEDGFWTGGRDGQPLVAAFNLILDVVKLGLFFGMDDFLIAHRCEGFWVPIDHAQSAVDVALGMQVEEGVDDAFAVMVVQRKAGPFPVAAGPQLAQLLQDDTAMFAGPIPCVLQEGVTGKVGFFDALIAEFVDHLGFGSDGRMVGSGHPTGVFALHAGAPDQDVLYGVVEHMAHVQHPGHIGRGDDDGIWFAVIRHAAKSLGVLPGLCPAVFYGGGVVL